MFELQKKHLLTLSSEKARERLLSDELINESDRNSLSYKEVGDAESVCSQSSTQILVYESVHSADIESPKHFYIDVSIRREKQLPSLSNITMGSYILNIFLQSSIFRLDI